MLNVGLAGDHLFGKLLFTWLSLVVSMVMSFCAVLFPTRCLGWDLELDWVSFWGFSFLLLESFSRNGYYGMTSSTVFEQSIWSCTHIIQTYSRCAPSFLGRKNIFWQNYGLFKLRFFRIGYYLVSICETNSFHSFEQSIWNFAQLIQTNYRCPPLKRKKNYFWQIHGLFKVRHFSRNGYYGMTSLYNQLFPQFLNGQFKTAHRHTVDVHLPY